VSGGIRINAGELRYQREKRVLSCKELAQEAGIAASTYYALESGYNEYAGPETIRKLAAVLRVKPQVLVDMER